MSEYIKDYKIIEEVGSGGMGKVFKAIHPGLKNYVIIKQLSMDGDDIVERFKREAKIMMNLHHDNIVPVYDYFIEGDQKYIVMEYIDGVPLSDLIKKKGKLDSRIALLIFIEACKGLDYAHDKKIIHRDLKPANILISKKGEVKLIDFGIAAYYDEQIEDDKTVEALTQTGMAFGTPAYMSPEQIGDTKNVTPQSDIYTMGIILYEMLTGERPFGSAFTVEAITKRVQEKYSDAKFNNREIPVLLNKIIKKTLKPTLSSRYKSISVPVKKLEKYTRKLSHKEIIENIASYTYNDDFLDSLDKIKPIYTSFLNSFKESKVRRLSLKVGLPVILILFFASSLVFSDYYYKIFKRSSYGSMEIEFNLPVSGALNKYWWYKKYHRLPDPNKYPGLYKERLDVVKKELAKYINFHYKDMLYNFQLTAILTREEQGRYKKKIEKIILHPVTCIENNESEFLVKLKDLPKLPKYLTLSSGKIFKRAGQYSSKLFLNGVSYRDFFKLKSFSKNKKAELIKSYYRITPKNQISFIFHIFDKKTLKEIRDYNIDFWWGGRIIDYKKFIQNNKNYEKLKNGYNYYFKIKKENYSTSKTITVKTGRNESIAVIKVAIVQNKEKNKKEKLK